MLISQLKYLRTTFFEIYFPQEYDYVKTNLFLDVSNGSTSLQERLYVRYHGIESPLNKITIIINIDSRYVPLRKWRDTRVLVHNMSTLSFRDHIQRIYQSEP